MLWLAVAYGLTHDKLHRGGATVVRADTDVEEFVEPLTQGLDVNAGLVISKALAGRSRGDVDEIEGLLAESAAYMASRHPDYSKLACRIELAKLRRQTGGLSFSATMRGLHETSGLLDARLYERLQGDCEKIDRAVEESPFEDELDYFGYKTLERSYLLKSGVFRERPSQMLMRVALGLHEDWDRALETFELMAQRYYIHASPTLFHSGTAKPHLASCFLLGPTDDSIEGIYHCLAKCASISKAAGGIGLSVSDVRAAGSKIKGTGGYSNGLVPMLRVFDATARYVDQGGGKRPGAFAAYLEPWHADVFEFLDMKKNHGKEERRARDLFYGLWIPDLFMRRVERDEDWSLMCPDECPGLTDECGAAFDELYESYEKQNKFRRVVKARKLWRAILDAQIETGTPYMLYKDACNLKSNQRHLGTVKCSNLCCEIIEFSNATEVAVCNLASLVLPSFVKDGTFDLHLLRRVARTACANLDAAIDRSAYPSQEAQQSNLRHRPIGLGIQGLADTFLLLKLPFDSPQARDLNRDIFETLYFAALEASNERARLVGPHESYEGSPASMGKLQPDLWDVETTDDLWNWTELRANVRRYGLRNSLLVAPMPTASTAQIVGVNECFEPYTSNLYARRVKAGEFVVANKHLVKDLAERGLWDEAMRFDIVKHQGSVLDIPRVPADLKALYKTAWELRQKALIDLAAARAPFVDQSQSLNAFIAQPDYDKVSAFHFHGWRRGLKTGMYYLRTKPALTPTQVTLDPSHERHAAPVDDDDDDDDEYDGPDGSGGEPPVCLSCSG